MIEALQAQWGIPTAVTFAEGRNGLPLVTLTHASGARTDIYLHGAHVTSWAAGTGEELFFLSQASHFAPDRPIRGGIPVIFPQFGGGLLPQHGFARTSAWKIQNTAVACDGAVQAELVLEDTAASRALWPHLFRLQLAVELRDTSLALALQVTNRGTSVFPYHAVLHTYLAVSDIRMVGVRGLQGTTYIDSLRDDLREVETRPEIRFAEETDRIYVNTPDAIVMRDESRSREVRIVKTGMPDVVVWNPWIDKARRMVDFGDDEYRTMVCVETGNMAGLQVLRPGESRVGQTVFSAETGKCV